MYKKILPILLAISAMICSCSNQQEKVTPEQAKQIAEEAYIFAYPMIEHYKMMFAMAMYEESGAYEAPFNVIKNRARLSGPKDIVMIRPNNDTFYSAVWFDLEDQPQILNVPAISDNRYYSFQIIDMYTHNIDYIGTRTTGFDAGVYMFVGPNWNGETPEGINKVIKSEGNFLVVLGRTQIFGQDDVENATAAINKYSTQSLNNYLGLAETTVIKENPAIPPFNPSKAKDINFISYLNALMAQGEIHKSEKSLFDKFAKIGIAPGKKFDPSELDSAVVKAINDGAKSAMLKIKAESMKLGERKNGWQLISGAFGSREAMQGKYLTRAGAAYFGLWANDLEEAYYPETTFDSDSEVLDGAKHKYILHFEADELPPVKAFWSLSMYKMPEQLFMENEIDRYIISSVTEGLHYNEDGSLDVYIQQENPGNDKESNWLPANNGEFSILARLYWPKPEALNPLYVLPSINKVN